MTNGGVAELRGVLPGLEVYGVARAGHMVAGAKNDVFGKAIGAFLRRHASL